MRFPHRGPKRYGGIIMYEPKAAIRRAAGSALEALQRLPLPPLSSLAVATLGRPGGSLR